MVTRAAGLGG